MSLVDPHAVGATPTEVVLAHLASGASGRRLVLLEDPHRLLAFPARLSNGQAGVTVIQARGNLGFRLRYEPLRSTGAVVWVVRQRPDVFLPDVEARADTEGLHLHITPCWLLQAATGEDDWPAWTEREEELVTAHLPGIVRAWRHWRSRHDEAFGPAAAEAVLLRGATGIDVTGRADVADLWQAFFRSERLLRRLHKQGSPLAARLQGWLKGLPPPAGWLELEDPTAAVRLTWLVAILQPHLPALVEELPRLYPGAHLLKGHDPTALARVAYRLERLDPELAAAQRDVAENVLDGPLRQAVVRLLGLTETASAARLIRKERRSGHLALLALRCLLAALAADAAPHGLELEPELEQMLAHARRYSHPAAVAAHAGLLRALLRLDRARTRCAAVLAAPPDATALRRIVSLFVEGEGCRLDHDLATARETLADNATAETCWDPVVDPERHKAVLAALYQHVQAAEQRAAELERRFAVAVLADSGGLPAVPAAWDDVIAPLLAERACRRVTLVLVAGLTWAEAEGLAAGPLSRAYDTDLRVLLASPPACAEVSLRRAVAGAADAPDLPLKWADILAVCRPESGLHRARRVPVTWRPLADEGLLVHAATSPRLCLLLVDLTTGHPAGVPADEYARRVASFGACLQSGGESGRRDELLAVMATSGAVACREAPGLALPGVAYGPRCLVTGFAGPPPPEALRVSPAEVRLPGAAESSAFLAVGRGRLAPAAAEPVVADGGLSPAEMLVPLLMLSPLRGERAAVTVGSLLAPGEAVAGRPVELALHATLTAGALAEVAVLTAETPGRPTMQATLDLGERRRLACTAALELPEGVAHGEVAVEVVLQVGRRRWRRRALVAVTAPAEGDRDA
ncbi:MAG: hypothetical protein HYU66_16700 [Armatimonadetes bacterium]|nr:hypothetical protein [Armatimonadota bacterium]